MLATVTYMGFGIPFIYMGQEVGLVNCPFDSLDEMKDPVSHFVHDLMVSYGMPKKVAFGFVKYGARDHNRVPIAWDGSVNGGFNEGMQTWQKVNPNYAEINVRNDLESEKSIYRYYQKLLQIKKNDETAIYGETVEYDHDNKKVIAYSRQYNRRRLFVVGNFSNRKVRYELPVWVKEADILLDNYPGLEWKGSEVILKPYQALVFEEK